MREIKVYAYTVPDWLIDGLWEFVVSANGTDTLFYALWAYMVHDDSFYLEDLYVDVSDSRDYDERLGQWVDGAYNEWHHYATEMREDRSYNLAGVLYEESTNSIFVILKLREHDEPSQPCDLPAKLLNRTRTTL